MSQFQGYVKLTRVFHLSEFLPMVYSNFQSLIDMHSKLWTPKFIKMRRSTLKSLTYPLKCDIPLKM